MKYLWPLFFLLSACASTGSTWVTTRPEIPFRGLKEVEAPCGLKNLLGCAELTTGMIYLQVGLPPRLKACVEKHERRHLKGDDHEERPGFLVDCGDGTFLSPPFN